MSYTTRTCLTSCGAVETTVIGLQETGRDIKHKYLGKDIAIK